MKLRVKYSKTGYIRYISHLDTFRFIQRTLHRLDVPVIYSEGFNPHPKLSLAQPLPLGCSGDAEFFDVDVDKDFDFSALKSNMNSVLPEGLEVTDVKVEKTGKSVEKISCFASMRFEFPNEKGLKSREIEELFSDFMKSNEILVTRLRKKGKRKIKVQEDIRPGIISVELSECSEDDIIVDLVINIAEGSAVRPVNLVEALIERCGFCEDKDSVIMHRKALLDKDFKVI